MQYVVILFLVALLYCLGSAFYHLLTGSNPGARGVQQFTMRIAFAVGLFALLMACYKLGLLGGQP
jgi:hypothetical protein